MLDTDAEVEGVEGERRRGLVVSKGFLACARPLLSNEIHQSDALVLE